MEEIVKTIASALGPGKIQKKPFEDAFLTQDLSVMEIDSFLINLCMEAACVKELLSIPWVCEGGLVENMELVVEEYRQTRRLLPIRLCVLGPPAVGKSSLSQHICDHYKLHHISLKDVISETISQLEETVKNEDPEADTEDSATEVQELLDGLKDSLENNGGHLDDQLLVKVMKNKLMSNPCRNQGFVLDGFPKTYEQAKALFSVEEEESEERTSKLPPHNEKIIPGFVLTLDASDAFLKDRVMNLPERLVEEKNYQQEHFLQQLARYRADNLLDTTVLNYFDELDIMLLHMEITSSDDPDCLLLMHKIKETVGPSRNYGPSSQEVEEEERQRTEERMMQEAQEKAEKEQREAQEAMQRAALWEEWRRRLEEGRQQEEELLEAQSLPMRNYLMEHVMPTLSQGLIQCCTVKPHDPVDFLAEYLLKNNPRNY
ncbi:hypothetical protein LDENG_00104690 [Lucifuga dentata]|nr:hypothetical protein LDENG_00104690 [Lucifuga dentata]